MFIFIFSLVYKKHMSYNCNGFEYCKWALLKTVAIINSHLHAAFL